MKACRPRATRIHPEEPMQSVEPKSSQARCPQTGEAAPPPAGDAGSTPGSPGGLRVRYTGTVKVEGGRIARSDHLISFDRDE